MFIDKSIVTRDIDDDDTDGSTALRNKPTPKFRYPPGLRPEDRDNRASLSRNDPIIIQDQDIDSSVNDTSEERNGNKGSLSTSPTSMAGLESG